jgi:hypothetical protein
MLEHYPFLVTLKQLLSFSAKILILKLSLVTIALADNVELGDFSNNYEDSTVSSNNNTDSTTNNYNATGAGEAAPVMSSIAPTVMGGGGNDSCLLPTTSGLQLSLFGYSQGTMKQDEYCNRRKNSRLLGTPQQLGGLGLQISGISIICDDPNVFKAMILASTPCPIMDVITGKLLMGKKAVDKYRENPDVFIVGYEDNKKFWDKLLRIGEDLTDETIKQTDTSRDTRSLSERFRTTRTGVQSNRRSEDTVVN